MSDLTTKAAEIRAGLGPVPVIETFAINPVGEGDIVVEGGTRFAHERDLAALIEWAKKAAALIEQQAAELAEQHLRHETGERITRKDLNNAYRSGQENGRLFAETVENRLIGERAEEDLAAEASLDLWRNRASTAESERDELLREKERLGALARKLSDALLTIRPLGGSELFMRVGEEFYADPAVCSAEIARLRTDLHEAKVSVARERRARWALENGPAGLADAHSKSPTISSQSERIAVLEAALRPFADFAQWTDAEGWTSNIHREGISVWFGPSDFRRARSALAPLGEE